MADFKSNIWKVYLFKFFVSLDFIGAVLIPFFTDWGGITFTQVMLIQSWFLAWVFILEIPTGTVADYFGRKHSLALGVLITVIAAIVYASMPNFYIFLLGEFLFAIGDALFSGADEAFTYDTLKKIKKTKQSKKIFARMQSWHLGGIMIGAILGGIIAANLGLRAPMLLLSIPLSLAFLISLTLKEPKSRKRIESKRYTTVLKEGVKFFYKSKALKILALDMIFIASVGYYMIWLYQPILKQAGVGIAYFGMVHAALVVSQIALMNNFERLEKIFGTKRRLIFITALMSGLMFILAGLTTYIPLVLAAIILGAGFSLSRRPLFVNYMNKHIPSSKRATVLSTISMLRRFVLVVANPIVGLMVVYSLNNTLLVIGAVAIIFAFISRTEEKHLLD